MRLNWLSVLLLSAFFLCAPTGAERAALAAEEPDPVPRVGVEEALRLHREGRILFLDARSPNDYEASQVRLPGARRVATQDQFERFVAEVPRDRALVAYCT